jgi:hypothetical protein
VDTLRVHQVIEPLPVLQYEGSVRVTDEDVAVDLAPHLVEGQPGRELRLETVVHVGFRVRGLHEDRRQARGHDAHDH